MPSPSAASSCSAAASPTFSAGPGLYRIGLCIFVLASISGRLAVEPGLLIASRAVQGFGASMLAPAGLSLLVTSWPDEQQRSNALGVYGAVASAGFAAGAVIGGLLVAVSWRLVSFVNIVPSGPAQPLLLSFSDDTHGAAWTGPSRRRPTTVGKSRSG